MGNLLTQSTEIAILMLQYHIRNCEQLKKSVKRFGLFSGCFSVFRITLRSQGTNKLATHALRYWIAPLNRERE